jgi:hypothetical protein
LFTPWSGGVAPLVLNSPLDEDKWLTSHIGLFTPGVRMRDWTGSRAGMDVSEKSFFCPWGGDGVGGN